MLACDPVQTARAPRVAGLTILNVHLDCRAVGHLARPEVQVLALSRLKKEDVVAVVQLRQLVELVQLRFRVELGIFPRVGHHGCEVVEQVSMSEDIDSFDQSN